jgi:hypothetical protein
MQQCPLQQLQHNCVTQKPTKTGSVFSEKPEKPVSQKRLFSRKPEIGNHCDGFGFISWNSFVDGFSSNRLET